MISLYLFVLLPVAAAMLAYFSFNRYVKVAVVILQTGFVAAAAANFLYVKANGPIIQTIGGWNSFAGITLRADTLSSVMVWLTAFMFLAFLLYDFSRKHVNRLFIML